jgi:alkylated DNA repair dioxygenase AlkB
VLACRVLSSRDFTRGNRELIALSDGSSLAYYSSFIASSAADALYRELADETPWDTNVDGAFARPRRTYWIGHFSYTYSGVTHHPAPWTPTLEMLRGAVEEVAFGTSAGQFRGVLMNLYRSGADSIGFHSDDEPEIEPESPIVSISLGSPRTFILKVKRKRLAPERPEVPISLLHGSCLVMLGRTQIDWRHGIPAEPQITGGRVNLTFRRYRA